MHNTKDLQFVGKHDYDKDNSLFTGLWNKTFSVGIFQWHLKGNGKEMKKSKSVVRISGPCEKHEEVFKMAESIVLQLDNGEFDGRKTIVIK